MIPSWNNQGVIPPVRGLEGNDPDRSPYIVTLQSVVERFASSKERIRILKGLLDYRAELYKIGLTKGFQWLDGSFMENIEILESRPPHDMDVVTFFYLPQGETQKSLLDKGGKFLFGKHLKEKYFVDAYLVTLSNVENQHPVFIRKVCYWYSMWSHRRSNLWKGFLQISLNPKEDELAKDILQRKMGGQNEY